MRKRECYGRTRWNGEKVLTFTNILRRYRQVHNKRVWGVKKC